MTTFTINRQLLPESPGAGRLGRHVNHDSRSRQYRPARAASPVSKSWRWLIPTLDQGDLGSCVGNGSTHQLGCDGPVYQALLALLASGKLSLNEDTAVKIYSLATQLDGYSGDYPPTDTGSDGLSGAKAAKKLGLIGGYVHALSEDDLISGLQKGAGMVGTNWTSNMDTPNSTTGVITKPQSGTLRGGHEYCVYEIDLDRGLLAFRQSWGKWGIQDPVTKMWGRFLMQIEDFTALLKQDGDATFFTPLTAPAPTPTPVPPSTPDQDLIKAMDPWAATIISRITKAGKAKNAYENWKKVKGL